MKKIKFRVLILLVLISSSEIFAQQTKVLSVASGDTIPLAYTSIYLTNAKIGLMTDTTGQISLPDAFFDNYLDTLTILSLGYKTLKIPIPDLNRFLQDTGNKIILDNDIVALNEVVVYPSTAPPKDYGFYHLGSSFMSLYCEPGSRLCVFVENTDDRTKMIQNVKIKVSKSKDKTHRLRLFFCSKSDDGFVVNNFTDEDIIISDFSKTKIIIDVSKYAIPFTEDGIYVGVEWIVAGNELQDMSKKTGIGLLCTSKSKSKSTWLYNTEKWVQYPSVLPEEVILKIPRIFRNTILNANAQIGISAK